jgi:hypothetical protein
MERQYQDYEFEVIEARNRVVTELFGVVDNSRSDMEPTLVFVLFAGATQWHRFFVDIGAAFWDLQTAEEHQEEIENLLSDDMRVIDYLELLSESELQLDSAGSVEQQNDEGSIVTLRFKSGVSFELIPSPPGDDEYSYVQIKRD